MSQEQIIKIKEIIAEEVQKVLENNKNGNSNYFKWIYLNLGDGRVIRYNYDTYEESKYGTVNIHIAEYYEPLKMYFDQGYLDFDNRNQMQLAITGSSRGEEPRPTLIATVGDRWRSFGNDKNNNFYNQKEKDFFINYWQKIIELLPNLEYSKELTESIKNLDEKVIRRINRAQYKKEMINLKESNKNVLPTVEIAVEWWANAIKEFYESDHTIDVKGEEYFETKSIAQIKAENNIKEITEEQLQIFKETLAKTVMKELSEDPVEEMSIEVNKGWNDGRDGSIIEDALIASGIPYAPAGCIDLHTWYVKEKENYLYYNNEPLESFFQKLTKKKSTSKSKRKK